MEWNGMESSGCDGWMMELMIRVEWMMMMMMLMNQFDVLSGMKSMIDWNCMESSGMEWNAMEWNGMVWNGMD